MTYDQQPSMEHNYSKFDPCPQKCTYEFDFKPLLVFELGMDTGLETIFTGASKYRNQTGQVQMPWA